MQLVETRPSGDGTFPEVGGLSGAFWRGAEYTCRVQHKGLQEPLTLRWHKEGDGARASSKIKQEPFRTQFSKFRTQPEIRASSLPPRDPPPDTLPHHVHHCWPGSPRGGCGGWSCDLGVSFLSHWGFQTQVVLPGSRLCAPHTRMESGADANICFSKACMKMKEKIFTF